jgi:outer membrane protein assembly factor BamB
MKLRTIIFAVLLCGAVQSARGDDWPQWRGAGRDGVWSEEGIIDRFETPQIELKWSVPIGSGYTGPTVAAGRVYVMDRATEPMQIERVLCFDWQTGESLWSHAYECIYANIGYQAGPRASVTIEDGRAVSIGAMGHLFCFDAATGEVLWNRDLNNEYAIRMPKWGIASAPLIEGDLVIVHIGGEDACLVAFEKTTGQQRWQALPDDASYSAPIVVDQAGQRVLVCYTGDRIVGLDPATGKLHWSFPFAWERWPIAISTPVIDRDRLLLSDAHKGSLLLRLKQDRLDVEQVWHRRRENVPDRAALHCLNSTPLIDGAYIYGADSRGVLRCLRLETGEQVWEDRTAVPEDQFATIHLVRQSDRTWLFNERGELIIARLTPQGFQELSRAKLIDTTADQNRQRRGGVTWSHPAFAYRHVFARNDRELVCADLSAESAEGL